MITPRTVSIGLAACILLIIAGTIMLPMVEAQAPGSNAQTINLTANIPSPVSAYGTSVSVLGTPGTTTYYYWIVSNYPVGNSVAFGPVPIYNAPNTLDVANYVRISWAPVAGATTYDVLRTTSSTLPPSGNIAVSTAQSATFFDNNSAVINAYTVSNAASAGAIYAYLNNQDYNLPTFTKGIPEIVPSFRTTGVPTMNCVVGWAYFQTNATAGNNVWLCTATNTWTQLTSGLNTTIAAGTCITVTGGPAYTVSVNQACNPTWTGTHTWTGPPPTVNANPATVIMRNPSATVTSTGYDIGWNGNREWFVGSGIPVNTNGCWSFANYIAGVFSAVTMQMCKTNNVLIGTTTDDAANRLQVSGTTKSDKFNTTINCAGSTCFSASSGSSKITNPATAASIGTTAVTADSVILISPETSLNAKLGATCITVLAADQLIITGRTGGVGFTVSTVSGAGPAGAGNSYCFNWLILN